MAKALETKLNEILMRLEVASEEIRRSQVVNRDVEAIRVLAEIIKEQTCHEDTDHTARTVG